MTGGFRGTVTWGVKVSGLVLFRWVQVYCGVAWEQKGHRAKLARKLVGWKIKEEVYVCQPPRFKDLNFLDRVYKVKKAQYGLHQDPRACQDKYAAEILKKFGFTEIKTASTPMETQKPLLKDEDGKEVDVHKYRSMIGSLMYLRSLRPDIMFAVCACARYKVNPKVSYLYAGKKIFKYLKGQLKLGLWYPKDSLFDLVAYTDSDYAGASLDRKSTIGGCYLRNVVIKIAVNILSDTLPITANGGDKLVNWSSKKQECTSISLAEAEYVSLSTYYAQVLWMRTQLTGYGFHFDKIPMYCDSKAAIAILCNPVQHSRTKHIDVRYHFRKEKVENGIVELFFVGTEYQLADVFTKALPEDRFKYLVRQLGMRCLTPEELQVLANESA
nr:hypothetical protein [Tanacetum cinerariifolium]